MKRAYNYFFGGTQPAPAPASPSTPLTTTDVVAPSKDEPTPRENGIDTPPETPRQAPLSEDEAGKFDALFLFTCPITNCCAGERGGQRKNMLECHEECEVIQ